MTSRRRFLAAGAAVALLPELARAQEWEAAQGFWDLPRSLWLNRVATGEEARVVYWRDGRIDPVGYWTACRLLRDVKGAAAVQMDIGLLNLLRAVQGWFEGHGMQVRLDLLSGYRTARTNAQIEGAALNSAHLSGTAADFRIVGVPASYLGRLTMSFQGGGVGFYLVRDFIHADVDRRRAWVGR